MEPYYYTTMTKSEQAAYRAMEQGIRGLADSILTPRLDRQELGEVFFRLRLDHPDIFWAAGFSYGYYPDSPNLIVKPEYLSLIHISVNEYFERLDPEELQKVQQKQVYGLVRIHHRDQERRFCRWPDSDHCSG